MGFSLLLLLTSALRHPHLKTMNPMTNVKNIIKLSEQDLKLGGKSSWHDQYKGSAWIFIGGLPYGLTEGDIICVFSQYGEIVHINLVRDKDSGKQKGFCFICYEDQRSTILAVDNLNGIKILGRTLRVDHVSEYKVPKESKKNPVDEEIRVLRDEGCAPSVVAQIQTRTDGNLKQEPQDGYTDVGGVRLPPRLPLKNAHVKTETSKKEVKKEKSKEKPKKSKKERKKKKRRSSSSSSDGSSSSSSSDSSDSSEPQRKHKKKKKK